MKEKFRSLSLKEQFELINLKSILTPCESALHIGMGYSSFTRQCHTGRGKFKKCGPIPHFHFPNSDSRDFNCRKDALDLWSISKTKGFSEKELIDFRKSYNNNIGRNEIEINQEVTRG